MSNLNDIINQVSHLTGYRLDPITLNVSSSAPSGTIDALGIYPGSIIKSEQVLNIINALNGTTSDFIIVSGSFALPSITGSQSLVVSGGLVYGAQTVGSSSYAVSASLPLQGITSASVASTTVTFYKGDGSSFSINIAQSGSIESSSYAVFAQTAATASTAISASYALTASFVATASSAITSSYAISSSLAQTASFVTLAQTASFINLAKSASFALTASYLLGSISSSISSSYAAYAQTYAPVFPYTGSALISGSLQVIGQTQLSSSLGVTGSVGFSYFKSTPNIGVWSVGNPLNFPRYNLAGAGTADAALAFGGNYSGSSVGTTETYDGFSSVWTTSEAMVYGRELMAGFGTAGAAVAAGGFISTEVSGSNLSYTETYDGNTWTIGNNLNTGRQALAGVGTQAAGLAFGGYNGVNPQAVTEKYSGSIWTTSNNLSTARGYLAGAGSQNAALAIGGTNGSILASTERYNGTTWSTVANLNVARYSLAAAGTAGAALAFGGFSGSALTSTEEYNGVSWAIANPLNNANSNLAGAGSQTAGIAFGGTSAIGYTEFYNPETVGILTKTFDYSAETGNITATGSLFGTSSHASYAVSASYALTASYWQGVQGPKSITGSLVISGSQTFENIGPAKFSGSTGMTGSLDVVGPATIPNLTGSLFGSASYALTASLLIGSIQSSSYALSSSYSVTSSLPLQGIITASIAANTITFRKGDNTTFDITVSQSGSVESASYAAYAAAAGTASIAISSSYALTASYALNVPTQSVSASYAETASYVEIAQTASYVLQAISASYAMTSSRAITASVAILAEFATSAGNTPSASRATSAATADNATSSSYASTASTSVSSSYALTASYALNVPNTASYANTASYVELAQTASYVVTSQTASYVATAQTASYVLNAVSASYSTTSSLSLLGITTASANASTITFTKGDQTTFDVIISQSGSVETASYAVFAENAATASYVATAQTASYVLQAVSSSYATTSSLSLLGIVTASVNASTITFTKGDESTFDITIAQSGSVETASYAVFAENAGTASTAVSSSYALTASYALNVPTQSVSSSYALTASYAEIATYTSEWILGANGNSDYTFSGPGFTGSANDPTIYLVRGQQYKFNNPMGAHPFRIQTTINGSVGPQYTNGVTNNDVVDGTLLFNVPMNAPEVLYYQCTAHASMGGPIYILNQNPVSSSYALTASYADTSSYALTASYALNVPTQSVSSSYALSASYAVSSSYTTLAANADTASYVLTAQTASYVLNAISSSRAVSAETSSLPLLGVVTASANASTITFTRGDQTTFDVIVSQSGSVQSSSYATFAENAGTSSIATSASYALTASYALNVPTQSVSSSYAESASVAISSSYATSASIANIQYVTNSGILSLSGIEVADYDSNTAVTFTNGVLKFVFGTPTVPSSLAASLSGFDTNRFNQVTDNYTVLGSWSNGGYTLISASLYEGGTFLTGVTDSGTSLSYNTTTSGSHTYRLAYTASSPLDSSLYLTSTTTTGTLSKTAPGSPTISATATMQLGAASSQFEQGATGSIAFTSASGTANSWIPVYTTSSVASPYAIVGSLTGSTSVAITATSYYSSSGVSGSDNSPALTTTSTSTTTYTKIRSLRSGASLSSSFTQNQLENLSAWDTTLGGTVGTIQKGTTTATGQTAVINWTGSLYQYIAYNSSLANLTAINASGFNVSASFTLTTVGSYKVYRTTDLQAGNAGTTVTYTLI